MGESLKKREEQFREFQNAIKTFKKQNNNNKVLDENELERLEKKLHKFKEKVFCNLSPLERVAIARHERRPKSSDYISNLCHKRFFELCGDRLFADDKAIIGGLGHIEDFPVVIIGHEKGSDVNSRMERNFGMPHPEGFRKAKRLMKLAEKFFLPVVSFVDTPGAYPGLEAEKRGQGVAIADNLQFMMELKTPIIVVIIGEASSGGALGIAVGDRVAMLQHSYYSVISPEGCASILWKDSSKADIAARIMKINSENLLEYGIIDEIIQEPIGGAQNNPQEVFVKVKNFILQTIKSLENISKETLVDDRYYKFRQIGSAVETIC